MKVLQGIDKGSTRDPGLRVQMGSGFMYSFGFKAFVLGSSGVR